MIAGAREAHRRIRSAELDRDVDARVLALHQQRDGPRTFDRGFQLFRGLERLAVDRENDVARLNAGSRGRTADLLDHDAALHFGLLLLLTRQVAHRYTEARAREVGLRGGRGDFLLRRFADFHRELTRPAVTPHFEVRDRTR